MSKVVKRAISLPKEQDEKIKYLAKTGRKPYSAVVKEAVAVYLAVSKEKQMEEEYARYYADEKNVAEQLEIVEDFQKLAIQVWPEY